MIFFGAVYKNNDPFYGYTSPRSSESILPYLLNKLKRSEIMTIVPEVSCKIHGGRALHHLYRNKDLKLGLVYDMEEELFKQGPAILEKQLSDRKIDWFLVLPYKDDEQARRIILDGLGKIQGLGELFGTNRESKYWIRPDMISYLKKLAVATLNL